MSAARKQKTHASCFPASADARCWIVEEGWFPGVVTMVTVGFSAVLITSCKRRFCKSPTLCTALLANAGSPIDRFRESCRRPGHTAVAGCCTSLFIRCRFGVRHAAHSLYGWPWRTANQFESSKRQLSFRLFNQLCG